VTRVIFRAGDGHEALQNLLVEDALRVGGGVVGHVSIDEGEGGLRDGHAGDRPEDKVWVLVNAFLESFTAKRSEDFEVVVGRRRIRLHVVELCRESVEIRDVT